MAEINDFVAASDRDADHIMKIIDGARKFQLMLQAIHLGIFESLETPQTAANIAKRHGYLASSVGRYLDTLAAMGLLTKVSRGVASVYQNSAASSKYLLMSKRPSFVWMAMVESKMIVPSLDKLPMFLKYGSTKNSNTTSELPKANSNEATNNNISASMDGLTMDDNNNESYNYDDVVNKNVDNNINKEKEEFHNMFLLAVEGFAGQSATNVATCFDLSEFGTAVDLGGGSGLIANNLAETYPDMDVISLDLPQTTAVAKKLNEHMNTDVTFIPGDVFEDELPQSDLYIMVHVLHTFNDERCKNLLHKVYQNLPPGGAIVVGEKFLDESKDGPEFCVLNDLTMALIGQDGEGRERTLKEYSSLLTRSGFRHMQVARVDGYNFCDVMMARKPIKS